MNYDLLMEEIMAKYFQIIALYFGDCQKAFGIHISDLLTFQVLIRIIHSSLRTNAKNVIPIYSCF